MKKRLPGRKPSDAPDSKDEGKKRRNETGSFYRRGCSIFIRAIPPRTKEQFRQYCERQGISMTDEIIRLMRHAIKYERKKPAKR